MMKSIHIFLITLFLIPVTVLGEEPPASYGDCTQVLLDVEKAGEAVTKKQVDSLLTAVNSACLEYVDTSEWINELLFSTLLSRPDSFVESFAKVPAKVQANIIAELKNPLSDVVDLMEVSRRVTKTAADGDAKTRILAALKSAAKNVETKIQK